MKTSEIVIGNTYNVKISALKTVATVQSLFWEKDKAGRNMARYNVTRTDSDNVTHHHVITPAAILSIAENVTQYVPEVASTPTVTLPPEPDAIEGNPGAVVLPTVAGGQEEPANVRTFYGTRHGDTFIVSGESFGNRMQTALETSETDEDIMAADPRDPEAGKSPEPYTPDDVGVIDESLRDYLRGVAEDCVKSDPNPDRNAVADTLQRVLDAGGMGDYARAVLEEQVAAYRRAAGRQILDAVDAMSDDDRKDAVAEVGAYFEACEEAATGVSPLRKAYGTLQDAQAMEEAHVAMMSRSVSEPARNRPIKPEEAEALAREIREGGFILEGMRDGKGEFVRSSERERQWEEEEERRKNLLGFAETLGIDAKTAEVLMSQGRMETVGGVDAHTATLGIRRMMAGEYIREAVEKERLREKAERVRRSMLLTTHSQKNPEGSARLYFRLMTNGSATRNLSLLNV